MNPDTDTISRDLIALRSGPANLMLDGSDLRWVGVKDHEAVRGLYVAVRDSTWGTVPGQILERHVTSTVDSFRVSLRVAHQDDSIRLSWTAEIVGTPEGRISFDVDALIEAEFEANRIGFCVLHPLNLCGRSVTAMGADGNFEGTFPGFISPVQPLGNYHKLSHQVDSEWALEISLSGDVFEMEDQRNWGDASFKSYCPPLSLPYPRSFRAGSHIHQRVELLFIETPMRDFERREVRRTPTGLPSISIDKSYLGVIPDIGTSLQPKRGALSSREIDVLGSLNLTHVRAGMDLWGADWPRQLQSATADARKLGVPLQLDLFADGDSVRNVEPLLKSVRDLAAPVSILFVFDREAFVTSERLADAARTAMEESSWTGLLGGGSALHFAELNRMPFPYGLVDVAAYPIFSAAHAEDDASIMETLETQPCTAAMGQCLSRGLPTAVGPVSFRQSPGRSPSRPTDKLQASMFGAAWIVASMAALARGGATWVTYFEASGRGGLVPDTGDTEFGRSPACTVLKELLRSPRAKVLSTSVRSSAFRPPHCAALALEGGDGEILFAIANLAREPLSVKLELPMADVATAQVLREDGFGRETAGGPWRVQKSVDVVDLGAYGVVIITGR